MNLNKVFKWMALAGLNLATAFLSAVNTITDHDHPSAAGAVSIILLIIACFGFTMSLAFAAVHFGHWITEEDKEEPVETESSPA